MGSSRAKAFVPILVFFVIGCSVAGRPCANETDIETIELVGHIEESSSTTSEMEVTSGLAAGGDYVYASIPKCTLDTDDGRHSCNEHWLRAVDVSDPIAPVEAALHVIPYTGGAMALFGHHIYVAQGYFGLRVLEIADPLSPSEVASCSLSSLREVDDIAIAESYAYISGIRCTTESECSFGLWEVDISNPATPAEIDFHEIVGDSIYSVLLTDNYVLVVQRHRRRGLIGGLAFSGDLLRIGGTSPLVLTEAGSLDLRAVALDMVGSENQIYIAYGQEGLQAIDISDPLNPIESGVYHSSDGIWSVTTGGEVDEYLYAASSRAAVFVFRLAE